MASTGFTIAGTGANNAAVGDVAWSNPGRVTASDNSRTTSVLTSGQTTQFLVVDNFSFSLAAHSVIDGIEVRLEKSDNNANDGIRDLLVRLMRAGTAVGANKADTATDWPAADTNIDYGGTADLWSTTWTQADIEHADFGVRVRANNANGGTNAARVDAVFINVHYHVQPVAGSLGLVGVGL